MKLTPFLLDQWLNKYHFADQPINYDLATSTGPVFTLRDVLELLNPDQQERLFSTPMLYCDAGGTSELREAIANMQNVDPAEVQIVTGAAEALLILFFLAAEPGANVILPFPYFPPFDAVPRSLGLESRYYHLRREDDFRIDLNEITRNTDANTKLILVNSPHNPTGSILGNDELLWLHDFAVERGIQLAVDEVYHPIYHGIENASAARLPHATVLGDFSKAFCLSGLRVGWILERNRHRMGQYNDARSYFTVSNTAMGEALAVAAVEHREVIFERVRRTSAANLAALNNFFTRVSDTAGWVSPKGGMTIFPWLRDGSDSRPFCEKLARQGVLVAPGDCFGMPSHFRLGFGATEDGFTHALMEIEALIRQDPATAAERSA
ncbi:MAG TPA: aminotransferase class I/II-fold pyridoxal phosphate-dependent enzyme [Blastocatellia bacterium]|nr:aminotransferase class I/II-fold pyridoxal phosphate-dependent enzyme [Blastocatellia bacterium]